MVMLGTLQMSKELKQWRNYTMSNTIRIGLIGDFTPHVKAHVAIPRAVALASHGKAYNAKTYWLATPLLEHKVEQVLSEYDAGWSTRHHSLTF